MAHGWKLGCAFLLCAAGTLIPSCRSLPTRPATVVLWAWERPEDLRFLSAQSEVAVESGSVKLDGDAVIASGRRFPLMVGRPPSTSVIHVEIERDRPLDWSPQSRAVTAAAILHYATRIATPRVQLDFEVRASERKVLLDVLYDLRGKLPRTTTLSMTALASWCGERWLDAAPVDEVVPMLFRLGRSGAAIRARLAAGRPFANPRCRTAIGISLDAPITRAPGFERVYVFNPRSWRSGDVDRARREVARWTLRSAS
jgi:hypothetical protein